jgi:hypothetical protein
MKLGVVAYTMAALAPLALSGTALAQQPQPQFPNATFFITSTSGPDGANFGGIEGADRHCQQLAERAGAGAKTRHAYLSVQATGGATPVKARDRIGKGPWVNVHGVRIAANVDDLHSPTNKIDADTGLTEKGQKIPGVGFAINQHDVLTGSTAEGRAPPADKDATCGNWTKNGEGAAIVGHADRKGLRFEVHAISWNAAHPSRGCSAAHLRSSGGAGLLYCFATN